jgi:formylglycine-generating enzyme required for sulfatase activity
VYCSGPPGKRRGDLLERIIAMINSNVSFKMLLIPGGTFQMGSKRWRKTTTFYYNVHTVTVADFYMGEFPVTNKEYKMFKPEHKGEWAEPDCPVENVSWYDTVEYCNWLSREEGLAMCYSKSKDNIEMDRSKNGYRLPTEEEWEYACRAKTTTEYYWGNRIKKDYCWFSENSENRVHPAGQKKPNAFGLYDMIGNVDEWCWDWYDYMGISKHTLTDNPAIKLSELIKDWDRACRGGSFGSSSQGCQSALRGCHPPKFGNKCLGFRLVRSAMEDMTNQKKI